MSEFGDHLDEAVDDAREPGSCTVRRRGMRARRVVAAVAAALIGLSAAACEPPMRETPPTGANPWPSGRTYVSTSITENGVNKPPVPGTRVEIDFSAATAFRASAGCNYLVANATIENGTMVVTDLTSTDKGCVDGRGAQDQWLAELLAASPAFSLSDLKVTLTRQATVIVLEDRQIVDPVRPLVGTRWIVETIAEGGVVSWALSGPDAILEIEQGGSFQATTGCDGGTLTGAAEVRGSHLVFTSVSSTQCKGAANALDRAVRATLVGDVLFEINVSRLMISAPDGHWLGLTPSTN